MFTGIIETQATLKRISREGQNYRFRFETPLTEELKVDQSVSHNGVCLTVEQIDGSEYEVVAIEETMRRTNFVELKEGDKVNLERAATLNDRLDGHIVQGHVDQVAKCVDIKNEQGSFLFKFQFDKNANFLLVDKGSICINGVSLTLVEPSENSFQVAIIPYTFEHTSFGQTKAGDMVNIEFDIIGKYVQANLKAYEKLTKV